MAPMLLALGVGCHGPASQAAAPDAPAVQAPSRGDSRSRERSHRRSKLAWSLVATRLPTAVSNNAVASIAGDTLVSMMGLTGNKTHADIVRTTMTWTPGGTAFRTVAPPPGELGRLASSAVGLDSGVLLFGGYTVAADGHEVSVPAVQRYDATADAWSNFTTMPVPVDDAVLAAWRDRVLLVSGWSNVDNVPDVQWLHPSTGQWSDATAIIGPPVFGHAGAVLNDSIVYCDGVRRSDTRPKYSAVDACFRGDIDPDAPERIAWSSIPSHPGPARYRMAAGRYDAQGWIVFAGGTANPYNYDGLGYDGEPSQPVRDVFAWDGESWHELPPLPEALMDHRGLVEASGALFLIGGMDAMHQPSDRVYRLGPVSTR